VKVPFELPDEVDIVWRANQDKEKLKTKAEYIALARQIFKKAQENNDEWVRYNSLEAVEKHIEESYPNLEPSNNIVYPIN